MKQLGSRWPGLAPFFVLLICTSGCSPTPSISEPADVRLSQLAFNSDESSVVAQVSVPDVARFDDLAHIELRFAHRAEGGVDEPVFAAFLNYSDRVDPIPPGNFGVVIDPASDDRSIGNVKSAAGVPERWDQESPRGALLKESNRWVYEGDLQVNFWVQPEGWPTGRYQLETRTKNRKQQPTAWSTLTEFNFTVEGIEAIGVAECEVRPVIVDLSDRFGGLIEQVSTITLVSYVKKPQDEGVEIRRWPGDRSSEFKYVEVERRDIEIQALKDGKLPLRSGFYQFEHNSVWGDPPSGFYGQSQLFELRSCDEVRVIEVGVYPAI